MRQSALARMLMGDQIPQQPQNQTMGRLAQALSQPNVIDQAQQQYPALGNLGLVGQVRQGQTDGRKVEFWPPNEPGNQQYPRPQDIPMGRPGVEVFDQNLRPIDVLGDVTSHYLMQTDPKVQGYYNQFQQSLNDDQRGRLREQYDWYQKNAGEQRPYDQWESNTGLPAYFRGYAFQQWPQDFNERAYTPDQRQMFDQMINYLKGQ